MCPEAGVLSAYLDGELLEPWKAGVQAHLQGCAACAATLDGLREVRRRLFDEEEPALVDTMVRVRNGLQSCAPRRVGRWRPVSVPLPVVVAAACLILALGVGGALSIVRPWELSTVRLTASPTGMRQFEVTGNPEDVQKILALLNTESVDRIVTFDIPKDIRLAPFGEPELRPALQRSVR